MITWFILKPVHPRYFSWLVLFFASPKICVYQFSQICSNFENKTSSSHYRFTKNRFHRGFPQNLFQRSKTRLVTNFQKKFETGSSLIFFMISFFDIFHNRFFHEYLAWFANWIWFIRKPVYPCQFIPSYSCSVPPKNSSVQIFMKVQI